MPEPRPNHLRRSLFAIWQWPRWVWSMLLVLTPIVYLVSAVPATRMASHFSHGGWSSNEIVEIGYIPVEILYEYSETYRAICDWEDAAMDWLLGTERLPLIDSKDQLEMF